MEEDKVFKGNVEKLRDPNRIQRLEVPKVIQLSTERIRVQTVLEIGVGTGVFTEALVAKGIKVTGIDVNPDMVAAAKQYAPQADLQVGQADKLTFANGAFDLVFFGLSFHELKDPVRSLMEARRVCKQRVAILEWPQKREEEGPPFEHRMPAGQIKSFAKGAGFYSLVDVINLKNFILYRLNR